MKAIITFFIDTAFGRLIFRTVRVTLCFAKPNPNGPTACKSVNPNSNSI